MILRRSLPLLLALLGASPLACKSTGSDDGDGGGDAGYLDLCSTPALALSTPACQLQVQTGTLGDGGLGATGAGQEFYIGTAGQHVWLWIQLPQTLPSRALMQLVAGYGVPSTPVDLSVNLLSSNQTTSLQSGVDNHSTGAPKPIEFLFPITQAGAMLFVDISDASGNHVDVHNPFSVYVDLVTDPDQNIPGVPTPITLSGGSVQTGSCPSGACQGVLSVAGRVDEYSVAIPSSVTRPILYLDVSAPSTSLTPPPAYTMSYQVLDSTGNLVQGNHVANPFLAVDLSTALLVTAGETYTIEVLGYEAANSGEPAPGDIRLTYTLVTEVLPDVDVNEPNDQIWQATPVTFSGVGSSSPALTGRLAYIGDNDWFQLNFPTTNVPTRLHYKLTPTTNGGRYPVVGTPPDRTIEMTSLIGQQGGTPANLACENVAVCPVDPQLAQGSTAQLLQYQLCEDGDGDGGALCLLSGRNEAIAQGFTDLQNFEGIIPVAPTGAPQTLFFLYKSLGGAYADDLDYDLTFDWEAEEGQDTTAYHNTVATAIPFGTLGGSGTQSGVFSVGYGFLNQYNLTESPPIDVRGNQGDYDAVPSTTDVYEVDFPAGFTSGSALTYGATWQLGWSLTDSSGTPAEDLVLEVQFCETSTSAPGCQAVSGPSQANNLPGAIAYVPTAYIPWYDNYFGNGSYTSGNYDATYSESSIGNGYSVAVNPSACLCFDPQFLPYGKFYVTVVGVDRTAWTDTDYSLTMGISPYPQTFSLDGGLSYPCPTNVDAGTGCLFINPNGG